MSESEGEIEYLDEDADIVQQCVQSTPTQQINAEPEQRFEPEQRLLVERGRRKRKKIEEEDSDYNPSDDMPESPKRGRKKGSGIIKKPTKQNQSYSSVNRSSNVKPRTYSAIKTIKQATSANTSVVDHNARKKMNICIPDYDDPLCLPVRALKRSGSDLQRLKNWNNVCLEHFKHCNTMLRPEKGETQSSSRSIVLRNVVHKETGKQELAVWCKTSVENTEGVRKSEIFQSILPKYREKKLLNPFNLQWQRREMKFHHVSEVVLAKEEHKNEEMLVVYKPKEKLSAVYKNISKPKETEDPDIMEDVKMCLKEVVCCKVCAPCYQTSWRGAKKNDQKGIYCPICRRASVSVYNLLTHLKAHEAADVRAHRRHICALLAKVVDYHYRCRVCLQRLHSIRGLREHLNTHKGSEMFMCEVGNHMAT